MNIIKTASLIIVLTLAGRLLGFFRSVYVSGLYGTGTVADAFNAALIVPSALFLVVPGAINAVLIPTMRGMLEKAVDSRAVNMYQKLLTIVIGSFLLIALLGVIFSYELAELFVSQGEDPALTAQMLAWMWPSAIFIGLVGLWSSVCNAHQHFFTPTLGSVANGAIVIVAMYLLVPYWGPVGLAIATTIGYLAACITMIPTMQRFGYRHRFSFEVRNDETMRSMGERVVPILIGAVIAQATNFLERVFAGGLGEGKLSALAYANQIAQLPMAIFVGAFTLPLFPLLATYVKRGDMALMKSTLQKGLAYLLILLIPVTVGLILYGEPLIRLVFERGAFGREAVKMTTWALLFYSLGLYALAARDLLTRAFYALENTRTPVIIGAIGIGVYIISIWLSVPLLGHGGVALSASISAVSQSLLLFLFLWLKIGSPVHLGFLVTAGRVALASGAMGGAILFAESWLTALPRWLHLSCGISGGALLYFLCLVVLREPLIGEVMKKFLRRSPKDSPGA